ncbi:Band 4.1-like protein 3 [Geodia barretti]|uniref:Band 4.1-like protein 3 n=1 Tax=Geodia barretti TaxID=519541 RepID=A0AA35X3L1_GEOBA|nr:Band 4.1-like protein 3 [Geodia barretti]
MAKIITCQVQVLDGSNINIDVNTKATGEILLEEVYKHLGLEETDYFGLQFIDKKQNVHWLDPYKVIKKQVGKGSYSFRFRVKLYPISPIYLFEEGTRYFLALQIKEDLVNEKLYCSEDTKAMLTSYVVQGEFGDYDPAEHGTDYLDDFPLLENRDPEFKTKVTELHIQHRRALPAECDKKFLAIACKLDRYGMDFHLIADVSNVDLVRGGVVSRVRIAAVNFKGKQLLLEMMPPPNQPFTETIVMNCRTKVACKTLWKSCVEHHSFFRSVKTDITRRPSAVSLLRRGSTFRYSGRTQYKLLQEGTSMRKRKSKRFERLSSRNKITRKTL